MYNKSKQSLNYYNATQEIKISCTESKPTEIVTAHDRYMTFLLAIINLNLYQMHEF